MSKNEINKEILTKLKVFPNIEELSLSGQFSDINFDSFINLKKLSLCGDLLYGFNFEVFKIIYNQLEELYIEFNDMNDEIISKLLYGHYFPNLSNISICSSKITRLEKNLFDGFPKLQSM